MRLYISEADAYRVAVAAFCLDWILDAVRVSPSVAPTLVMMTAKGVSAD